MRLYAYRANENIPPQTRGNQSVKSVFSGCHAYKSFELFIADTSALTDAVTISV